MIKICFKTKSGPLRVILHHVLILLVEGNNFLKHLKPFLGHGINFTFLVKFQSIFKRDPNFLVRICGQISVFSNVSFQALAIELNRCKSVQSDSNLLIAFRSDSIRSGFGSDFNQAILCSDLCSIQFLLFPIQSNRPDSASFGPIRSDSFRFRIRYNAFGPIQIL